MEWYKYDKPHGNLLKLEVNATQIKCIFPTAKGTDEKEVTGGKRGYEGCPDTRWRRLHFCTCMSDSVQKGREEGVDCESFSV